ncbi:hypothetical protein [Paenibacillus chitinolyticus]|uniref:hypothetical protein n=1 Tax=Paenibacillus chitinolyticus TaxID=79263 RepID=UPI001C483D37|nr:hypothetical protein [Paenibacillus chitinolyticus]MBV6715566.1 hypothetical protein [Paenibacillus chitinolyticus]
MNTYMEIVKEYKKEFSTKKFIKKYYSTFWIFRMIFQAILMISLVVCGTIFNNSIFLFIVYMAFVPFISWQFQRKLKKIDGEVLRYINKVKFENLLLKYNILIQNDPHLSRNRLTHLSTMLKRELTRKKLSARLFTPILFIISLAVRQSVTQFKFIYPQIREWFPLITVLI